MYETNIFVKFEKLLRDDNKLAVSFNYTFVYMYIDDVISINNPNCHS
jgi:hypothetical protein